MCHKVRMAARAVTRAYDEELRPSGLRSTQFLVLVAIGVEGAISISELATSMGMDRTTLTRNLGPLHKEELVIVGQEGWRRSRTLEITEKGRARLQEALPFWENAQRNLKKALGDEWPIVRHALEDLAHCELFQKFSKRVDVAERIRPLRGRPEGRNRGHGPIVVCQPSFEGL